jgi:hypothetical protein
VSPHRGSECRCRSGRVSSSCSNRRSGSSDSPDAMSHHAGLWPPPATSPRHSHPSGPRVLRSFAYASCHALGPPRAARSSGLTVPQSRTQSRLDQPDRAVPSRGGQRPDPGPRSRYPVRGRHVPRASGCALPTTLPAEGMDAEEPAPHVSGEAVIDSGYQDVRAVGRVGDGAGWHGRWERCL